MRMQLTSRTLTVCAVLLAAACSDQDQNSTPTDVHDASLKSTAQQPVTNPNALARADELLQRDTEITAHFSGAENVQEIAGKELGGEKAL